MVTEAPQPIAVITGGNRRIGAAIAKDLGQHGWHVVVQYNTGETEARGVAADIERDGGRATVMGCDLSQHNEFAALIPQIAEQVSPPTLLVNNAAMFARDELGTLDRATFDKQLAVNLTAPVFLAEAFAATLPAEASGNIVNILDQRVLKPLPVYVSYQLAKSALFTATKTLAQSLAPRIRVNGIAPGPTLAHAAQPTENFDHEAASVPLQRGADLAEFGRSVRFLVENASITGQTIALDGGQHLAWRTEDHHNID